MLHIKKGDIFLARLDNNTIGSEQGGERPVLIIQNNIGNRYSSTTIVAPITSASHKKKRLPTHVEIDTSDYDGLDKDSIILLEQIRAIDKKRIMQKIGVASHDIMELVDTAICVSFGLEI